MRLNTSSKETKHETKNHSPLSVVSLTKFSKKSCSFHEECTNHLKNPTAAATKIESIVHRLFPSNQEKDCNHFRQSSCKSITYDEKNENKMQKVIEKQIVMKKQMETEKCIPSNEELFVIGWTKAYDNQSNLYYYYTLDRSRVTWKNPLGRHL